MIEEHRQFFKVSLAIAMALGSSDQPHANKLL
jgi:hypothetical protein